MKLSKTLTALGAIVAAVVVGTGSFLSTHGLSAADYQIRGGNCFWKDCVAGGTSCTRTSANTRAGCTTNADCGNDCYAQAGETCVDASFGWPCFNSTKNCDGATGQCVTVGNGTPFCISNIFVKPPCGTYSDC